jgi:hypothetical protein
MKREVSREISSQSTCIPTFHGIPSLRSRPKTLLDMSRWSPEDSRCFLCIPTSGDADTAADLSPPFASTRMDFTSETTSGIFR